MNPSQGDAFPQRLVGWLTEHWRWLLVLAPFPLFVIGVAYHVPLGAMILLGFAALKRNRDRLGADPGFRLILVIFAALWIPQLIALPGAAVSLMSLRVAGRYLLYPIAAVYIVTALRDPGRFDRLALGIGAVVGFWTLDHLLGPAGFDLFSQADPILYPGGIFFREHTAAHLAAAASPLLYELVRRRHREDPRIWLVLVPLVLLVLISGRRVAWMMFAIASVAYLGLHARRVRWGLVLGGIAVLVATVAVAYTQHDLTRRRVDLSLKMLSPERAEVDLATSNRLDIWTTSVRTARANWPVGVGALGSRYVYEDYAAPDDYWRLEGRPKQHPHLFVLEFWVDTGLAGLVGYLVLLVAVVLALTRARSPWGRTSALGLLVAIFPLNAHASFYGSYWSMVMWWFIGLTAAGMTPLDTEAAVHPREAPRRARRTH